MSNAYVLGTFQVSPPVTHSKGPTMHSHSVEPLHMPILLSETPFPFFWAIKSLPCMDLSSVALALGVPPQGSGRSHLRSWEGRPSSLLCSTGCSSHMGAAAPGGRVCASIQLPLPPVTMHPLRARRRTGLLEHRGKPDRCVSAFAGLVAWWGTQANAQDHMDGCWWRRGGRGL